MMSLLNIHAGHTFRLPEGLVLRHQVMRAAVLRIRIRDPGSGIGFFWIPDPKPIYLRAY
jgi:hypothetical protein